LVKYPTGHRQVTLLIHGIKPEKIGYIGRD